MKRTAKSLVCILSVVLLLMLSACQTSDSEKKEGSKTVTLSVIHGDGSQKDFEMKTDEEFLEGALVAEKLVEGNESSMGLFITTVDGEKADDSKQEWWCLTKGGEMWNYGAAATEISDGDKFEFTLTEGY